MQSYEFLRNVTIGQHLPGDSLVHRMDARAKIVATLGLLAAATLLTTYVGHVALCATLLVLISLAGIPVGYALNGLRPAIGMIVFLASMQILFYGAYVGTESGFLLWRAGPVTISTAGISLAATMVLRLTEMMLAVSLLTLTTSSTALARAIDSLLRPLSKIGFPAHETALASSIALRFVPTLAEELEKIAKAQASRGVDFGGESRWAFLQRVRRLVPLMVPLFVTSFRRAEDLALAMEARCYSGGHGRTSYRQLRANRVDYLAVGFVLALGATLVLLPFPL